MRFPILIKIWAGEQPLDMRYIRASLTSLLASRLPEEAHVVCVDDCSPNPALRPFLESLQARFPRITIWKNPEHMGPNRGQEYNVPRVWQEFPDAPFLVCCDDDVVYHPGWLQRLIQVYHEAAAQGLSGIFSALNVPFRPHHQTVRLPTSDVLLKQRQMALNWLVPREIYDRVGPFRDVGVAFDTDYTARLIALGIPVICLKPSYVQNVGYLGAYQSDETMTAPDYVGRRNWFMWQQDLLFAIRRRVLQLGERVPEGWLKDRLRAVARPIRSFLCIR
jgi:glycosyltransferase involved in cell wall biosynthesis